jgi:hypothetical protein
MLLPAGWSGKRMLGKGKRNDRRRKLAENHFIATANQD